MGGKLTIVPTPIGNLDDMTIRGANALRAADTVLAEDTRVTGKLLAALGIEGKRVERLDENLMAKRAAAVISRINGGETIAYCSDAGMPGISDPGMQLVREARAQGAAVEVLAGPTAVATAYVASGTTSPTFYFGGFFPRKAAARKALLKSLATLDAALIFYESPHRIVFALADVAETLPHREVAVCRELTKLHEEILRGTAGQVAETLEARDAVRGEIVLVIDAPSEEEHAALADEALARASSRASELAASGERPYGLSGLVRCSPLYHIPTKKP